MENKMKNLSLKVDTDDSDSDASGDEHEQCTETSVDVGLIDADTGDMDENELKLYRIKMRSPFFPSKVGGKPAWLDYSHVPLAVGSSPVPNSINNDANNNSLNERITLECDKCKSQLAFLLQIYAPLGDNDKYLPMVENEEELFHRVLYVFICRNASCLAGCKVLRGQLARQNDFYSYDSPPKAEYYDEDYERCFAHLKTFYAGLNDKNLLTLCPVCGLSCSKKCSRCSFAYFCSQPHQLFDWTKLNHKTLCPKYAQLLKDDKKDELLQCWTEDENSNLKYCEETSGDVFPEREIFIEPETLDYSKLKADKKEFKYDEKKINQDLENNEGNDKDFDELKENDYDKDFEKFKKISAPEATQIIRYERGGSPLWATKYGKLKEEQIPPCEHCGSKRIFEFQITPQLLCYLNLDEAKQTNSIDWAGLYIYTCIRNCKAANNRYANEYIYKQLFVS